jgi:hypothetical protein
MYACIQFPILIKLIITRAYTKIYSLQKDLYIYIYIYIYIATAMARDPGLEYIYILPQLWREILALNIYIYIYIYILYARIYLRLRKGYSRHGQSACHSRR